MIVKRGNVVVHTAVQAWGAGKVVEVAPFNATILFSDGVTRKIASSHFNILEAADPAAFITAEDNCTPVVKPSVSRAKKIKPPKPLIEV